ncbi:MAG: RNA ligase RtcB family protein [Snowella sp.]|nr:RNA ligase RtcB family protein [Snowella sp.]
MTIHAEKVKINIIASSQNWIEGWAIEQLKKTAELPHMIQAVGMPDLHPGKGHPIGAAFITKTVFYPYLVGNDIGCGMSFWKTTLQRRKIKLERWVNKLEDLDGPWQGDTKAWLEPYHLEPSEYDQSLGTIGGGNHFAELQQIESIKDETTFNNLGISQDDLFLLVHSGSRGRGESILRSHISQYAAQGLEENTEAATNYLQQHDQALLWSKANRGLIAHRFLDALGTDGECLSDVNHNTVTPIILNGLPHWLHRKGASPTDQEMIMIPGSRGTFSYLVNPIGEHHQNAYSLAHGAGRKWKRSDTKAHLSNRFKREDLIKTNLGSRVICEDKDLLYEEAPQAYKNIDIVIQDMVDAGLIEVIAIFRPVITYKTRRRA